MAETMLAGVFVEEGNFQVQERPLPQISRPDEVLVEIEGCGLCGTDLHILAVPQGIAATPDVILGHEFLGHVVEAGNEVTEFSVGDRVVIDPNLKCGVCRSCRKGLMTHCENWTTLGIHIDGGFTRFAVAPQRALHPISESVPFEEAVWTELLSCVVASTDRVSIQPGQTAVIVGAGPVGVLHGMLFNAAGARVIISDIAQMRLDMASKAGIDHTLNPQEESLSDLVSELTDTWGADVVVDAVGNQLATCLGVVARRGTVVLFGLNEHAESPIQQYTITRNEVTVFGTFVGDRMFPRAIEILEQEAITPSMLISHFLSVEEMPAGLEAARRGTAMKVVVRPDGE